MTICVYAITAAPRRPVRGTGLAGERLEIVSAGPLAAVIGRVRRPPSPTPAHLKKYDRVIGALAETLPAVLPARFGTCMETIDELAFVLRTRDRALRSALASVRGRVQMTLRMPDPGMPAAPDAPAPGADTLGAAYLRARAASAAREREVSGFEPVRHAVRRWVRDERVERRGGVVSVYHLVTRGSLDKYVRAAERAALDAGLRIRISGPFAPYAFAGW